MSEPGALTYSTKLGMRAVSLLPASDVRDTIGGGGGSRTLGGLAKLVSTGGVSI